MGVFIRLAVVSERIGPEEWARAYDDTLQLLQKHPSQLMSIARQQRFGVEVITYVRALEHEDDDSRQRFWHVVGDFRSKRHAESFQMYRAPAWAKPRSPEPAARSMALSRDDILLRELHEGMKMARVFDSKTQGEPFHSPLLAAAMIVESRFPQAAMVYGDICREDAEVARDLVAEILDQEVALPVRVDGPALWARLSALAAGGVLGMPINEAFDELFLGGIGDKLETMLTVASGHERGERLLEQLREEASSSQPPNHVILAWLDATGDLETLCRLACHDERGPRHAPEDMIRALAGSWHAIAAEDDGHLTIERERPSPIGAYLLGQRLRARMPAEAIQTTLARVFPDDSARLLALLDTRIAESRNSIRRLNERLGGSERPVPGVWHKNLPDLAVLGSAEELSDADRSNIRHLLAGVHTAAQPRPLPADAAACRYLIATQLAEETLVLTEDAWEWIAEEDELEVLQLLVLLSLMSYPPEPFFSVRWALFENRVLCHLAVALGHDAAALPQIE